MEFKKFAHDHTKGIVGLSVVTALAIGGSALARNGETSFKDEPVPTTAEPLTTDQIESFSEVCEDGYNLSTPVAEEYALSAVGAPDALGSSNIDADGNLISINEFADKVVKEACEKPDYLATLTAFAIEPAENVAFPNAKTLDRVKELAALYRTNPDAAIEAINKLAATLKADGGIRIENKFFLIDTQGGIIAPTRDENDVATGEELVQINDGGFRTVFLFNYDLTDPQLTAADKENRKAVSELVGIDESGRVILKQWFGVNNVDLTTETTASSTTEVATSVSDTGETVAVNPNSPDSSTSSSSSTPNSTPNSGVASSTSEAPTTGTTTKPNSGGSNGGGNGGGTAGSTPASTPDAPGAPNTTTGIDVPATNGSTPNTTPGTTGGPNTTPGTTGTTRPGTTTPNTQPSTSTATTPETTQPATTTTPTTQPATTTTRPAPTTTTQPATTTTQPKGTVPPTTGCDEFNPCN